MSDPFDMGFLQDPDQIFDGFDPVSSEFDARCRPGPVDHIMSDDQFFREIERLRPWQSDKKICHVSTPRTDGENDFTTYVKHDVATTYELFDSWRARQNRWIDTTRSPREKFWWFVHNVIAHPLSELLYWCYLESWGNALHDYTIPKHKGGTGRG